MGVKSGRFIIIIGFFLLVFGLTSTGKVVWAVSAMTDPAPGSTLTTTTVKFNWSAGGSTRWWLTVGSTQGGSDFGNSGGISTTSYTVSGIPLNGSTVYVKLNQKVGSNPWQGPINYTYQTQSSGGGGGGGTPEISSPALNSTLNCGDVTFNWSANGVSVVSWTLTVGTSPGGNDIASIENMGGTTTSQTVSGIPEDGSPIFVRLYYTTNAIIWPWLALQYTAASNCPVDPGSVQDLHSWSQILPAAERFELVMGGAGVLDKETGLVWEQSPDTTQRIWGNAIVYCFTKKVGGRGGWHLPSGSQLHSLVDSTQSNPALPSGHPFSNVQSSSAYWVSNKSSHLATHGWGVSFYANGQAYNGLSFSNTHSVWCVRGGQDQGNY